MKNILRSICVALLIVNCAPIALAGVDIGLFKIAPDTLEVRLLPDTTFSGIVSNVQFSLRWDASSNVSLGNASQVFPEIAYLTVVKSGNEIDDSGNRYQVFFGSGTQPMSTFGAGWTNGVAVVLMKLVVPTECFDFTLADDSWTSNPFNNGEYYISLGGVNRTGSIYQPSVAAIVCNDNDPCTVDSCSASGCIFTVMDCNDNDPCTTDSCAGGICMNIPRNCNDLDACTLDSCINGVCMNIPINCADTDPCTLDTCINGVCQNIAMSCDDSNPCTIDSCANGICINIPRVCSDNDPCTVDTCINGVCQFNPLVCDDSDPCTIDSCGATGCIFLPKICDDSNPCTRDTCIGGTCFYLSFSSIDSFHLNSCAGDSVFIAGEYQVLAGTYYDTLTNSNGCDSIILTELSLLPIPQIGITYDDTICKGGATILTATGGLLYQWSNGDTKSVITVSPDSTMVYQLIVSDSNGCLATDSATVVVEICIGVSKKDAGKQPVIYPNPFSEWIQIRVTSFKENSLAVQITDIAGKVVVRADQGISKGENIITIDTADDIASGIYFLEMESENARYVYKIVKL